MKHIVSFSGGKDSTAMLLRMLELKMPIDEIIFGDTGLEFPETYRFLDKVEKHIGMEIKRVRAKKTWDEYFYQIIKKGRRIGEIRGFPFVVKPCWAQRDLKTYPQIRLRKKGTINYIGFTKYEDRTLKDTKKITYKFPLKEWGWTGLKCLYYLKKKDMINPLYKKYKRLGCWLCPQQSKNDLRLLYQEHPEKWEQLKTYEAGCPHGFHPDFKLIDIENKWKYQTELKIEE